MRPPPSFTPLAQTPGPWGEDPLPLSPGSIFITISMHTLLAQAAGEVDVPIIIIIIATTFTSMEHTTLKQIESMTNILASRFRRAIFLGLRQ